jgi:hypothetical protein
MSIVLIPVLGVTFILIFAQTGSLALLIVSLLMPVSLGFSLLKLNHAKIVRFQKQWMVNPTSVSSDLPFGTPSPLNQCKLCDEIFPLINGRPEGLLAHYRIAHPEHHRWEKKIMIASMSAMITFTIIVMISVSKAQTFLLPAIIGYSSFVAAMVVLGLRTQRKFRRIWKAK